MTHVRNLSANTEAPVPLPPNLQNAVRVNWHLSSWCNYSCEYCTVQVFRQRSRSGQQQAHSFDYRPVADWLDVFRRLPYEKVFLTISGGEPFLDRKNFRDLLIGLHRLPHIRVGIASNGHWDPSYYKEIDKSQIHLVISWHPEQVSFDRFRHNLHRIREAGFQIWMVNFVLAPENIDHFDKIFNTLEGDGFFVNVSAMFPSGVYMSRTQATDREIELLERYNLPLDNYFKFVRPVTKGRLCFYPATTYQVMYDGSIRNACMDGSAQNLFTDGVPAPLREATACEYERCPGCTDMYRSLVDEPMLEDAPGFFSMDEYVRDVRKARDEYRAAERIRKLPLGIGRFFSPPRATFSLREVLGKKHDEQAAASRLVTIAPAAPVPEGPLLGYNDHAAISARSRDRISISGWSASTRTGAPIREVQISIDGHVIATFRHFFDRPDVAATYGRADLLRCGWRGMVYLPPLARGQYELIPEAFDDAGNSVRLTPTIVTVFE